MSEEGGSGLLGILILVGGIVGVGLVGAVLYLALVSPAQEKLEKAVQRTEAKEEQLDDESKTLRGLESDKTNLTRDVADARSSISRAQLERTQAERSNADLAALRKQMASEDSGARLVTRLKSLAEQSSVALKRIVPGEGERAGPILRVPYQLTLTGRYPDLATWLREAMAPRGHLLSLPKLSLKVRKPPESPFDAAPEGDDGKPTTHRLELQLTLVDNTLSKTGEGAVPLVKNKPMRSMTWPKLRLAFWSFGTAGLANKRDPFTSQWHGFVKPEPTEAPTPEATTGDGAATADGGTTGVVAGGSGGETTGGTEPPSGGETAAGETGSAGGTTGDGGTTGGDGATGGAAPTAGGLSAEDLAALTRSPTGNYEVLHITATEGQESAIVMTPQDRGIKVVVDTPLGNKSGRIIEITADGVLVDEPDATAPILLRMKGE